MSDPVPSGGARPRDPALAQRLCDDARHAIATRDWRTAGRLLERALALDDRNLDALQLYAWLALQAGHPRAALAIAQRWTLLEPGSPDARNVHGVASHRCGLLAQAIASLTESVALEPSRFDAQVNLGNALLDAGDLPRAREHYARALAIDPGSASVHNNLGNLHREARRHAEAIVAYRRAIELDPRHAKAHANLGNVLRDTGRSREAIAAYRRSLSLAPDVAETWSHLMLTQDGDDEATADSIADEHRAYGTHLARYLAPLPPAPVRLRAPGERLRVGLVSADFCRHAAASFIEPLLRARDASRIETFCYYNRLREDEVTARIRALSDHFLPVAGMTDAELATRVRADAIDVLLDLGGHTAGNRLTMFFARPAPVAATWLGYLGSTGVPTIDWRITDRYVDPVESVDRPGLERPWRLPRTLWCWQPHAGAPEIAPPPCADGMPTRFACFNNPAKTSLSALDAWADILVRVPDARLMLLVPDDGSRHSEIASRFARRGIDPARLVPVLRGTLREHLARHAVVDVALDTYPYSGGATTCDALWMGVPVVTLASDRPFGRTGASILAQVGLSDLVATTREAYVETAVAIAADRGRLVELRGSLRRRMSTSPLCDATAFARDFEDMLFAMASTNRVDGQ